MVDGGESSDDELDLQSSVSNSTTLDTEQWLFELKRAVGVYAVPIITWFGIVFNVTSIIFLRQKEARLRKSLKFLFCFLNSFDR